LSTRDVWPSVRIFKCYDSKAPAETLGKVITHNQDDAQSGDYGRSYFKDLRQWFRDSWTQLFVLFFILYSFFAIIQTLLNLSLSPMINDAVGNTAGVKGSKSKFVKKGSSAVSLPVKGQGGNSVNTEKDKKVTAVSPSAIYFSDNTCIRKGGKYELKGVMCDVLSVSSDYVLFGVGDKKFRVSTRLLSRMQ
jgi:hypothetical protein